MEDSSIISTPIAAPSTGPNRVKQNQGVGAGGMSTANPLPSSPHLRSQTHQPVATNIQPHIIQPYAKIVRENISDSQSNTDCDRHVYHKDDLLRSGGSAAEIHSQRRPKRQPGQTVITGSQETYIAVHTEVSGAREQ
eukprot:12403920-Karenia_brevis.AAC.1